MSHTKVFLGRAARKSVQNTVYLEKQAAAVAASIVMPAGIEFARFTHAGKNYALSAKMLVEVELLNNRVPDIVVRTARVPTATRRTRV
jgi:hypothetical protein